MGGGGASSLDSPKTANNSDFDDAQNDNDLSEDTITEYTHKTYNDYFTDLNITAETITKEDLTGSGSATDPYVVHSTRGFLWLTSNSLSGISLQNKYIELACDVILNDETFDADGNPSGGDGIVYDWCHTVEFKSGNFFGNNYTIFGLYINKPETNNISLFAWSASAINTIKDLTMSNYFIKGHRYVGAFAYNCNYMENCVAKNGFIISTERYGFGIVNFAKEIQNCINYSDVKVSGTDGAGIVIRAQSVIGCENYGKIINGSGIMHKSYDMTYRPYLKNCKNYGTISGTYVAGIVVGINDNDYAVFENCENYGQINGYYSGGITSSVGKNARVNLINCKSYGEIQAKYQYAGSLVYNVKENAQCFVENCHSNSTAYFVMEVRKDAFMYISNSTFIAKPTNANVNIYGEGSLFIKNSKLKYISDENSFNLGTFGGSFNSLVFENVIIDIDLKLTRNNFFQHSNYDAQGMIVMHNIEKRAEYYGTDFSGFYCDWKTGKIGLKAMSGKGFYQGEVTEELLLQKGFEKRRI